MPRRWKHLVAMLVLIALGVVTNWLRIPILFGVDFFFGTLFALVAAAMFGPVQGALVAIGISLASLSASSHPFFLGVAVFESFVIGIMTRRLKNNLLLASAVFWLVCGPVLIWLFYHVIMQSNSLATLMVWLKQSVNGIFNALLANLILLGVGLYRRTDTTRPPLTFHQVFFTTLVSLVLIPALILMIVTGRSKMASIENEVVGKTQSLTRSVDMILTGWRKARVEAVSELSKAASEQGVATTEALQRDIRHIAVAAAGFGGMMVMDEDGIVKASYVTGIPNSQAIVGSDYSDRPFFSQLKAGADLVISDVFMSRGLVAIPIVAFARPVIVADKTVGYSAGAADLTTLKTTLARYSSNSGLSISILDHSGVVVASTAENSGPLSKEVVSEGEIRLIGTEGAYHRLPPFKQMKPAMTRWEESSYGSRVKATNLPWTVVVEASLLPYSRELQRFYTEVFGLMLALCVGGLAISFLLTRWIGGPISSLADVTSGMITKVQNGNTVSWPWSPLKELSVLIENFKAMTEALQSRFHELQVEIKERTATQDKLVAATAAAESASQAKSEFLANMSHEIRTPLGAVLGFTELMSNRELSDTEQQEAISAIRRNGEQLYRLIDDVLDFSKIEVGHIKLEPIETTLDDIVRGSIDNLSRIAQEKGLALNVGASTPLPSRLKVDPTRLKQILLNIIGNAVKFTDRGYVNVDFSMEFKPDSNLAFLRVEVSDSGVGFSELEAQDKLFHVFGQMDASRSRRYGGTGLGLVLSRRLAQSMGGNVELIEAETGQGCVFEVTVEVQADPAGIRYKTLSEACAAGHLKQATAEKPQPLKGLHLLVVEDAPDNRLLFKRALTGLGATVEVAESGIDGVKVATSQTFDVIIMDIQMPGLDGLEATKLLRSQGYIGPIAALTAHALQEDRRRCLEAGFDDYLVKPVDWKRLTEVILDLKERDARKQKPLAPVLSMLDHKRL